MALSYTMLPSLADFHQSLCARAIASPSHRSSHTPAHLGQAFTSRRPRCHSLHLAQAVAGSLRSTDTPSMQEHLPIQAHADDFSGATRTAYADSHEAVPPAVLRPIWDGSGKPLLRIGRGGVQASHVNSFKELLFAHTLFKVQINQHSDALVMQSCQQLAEQGNARLLQVKGRTALFAQSDSDIRSLQKKTSAQQRRSPKEKATQQQLEKVWHKPDPTEEPVLKPDVKAQLQFLKSSGVLGAGEPDTKCLRSLSETPPAAAVTLLRSMNKTSMRPIKNKSAWLNSQCRRLTAEAR